MRLATPDLENKALRERLSEASLRINESLDFGTVLQGGFRLLLGYETR